MCSIVFFSEWGKTIPAPRMGNGMNKVLPGLFIGNFRDSKDQEQLTKNNITHILSIHDNAAPILKDKKYLCICVSDTPDQDLSQYFHKCIKFIHECRLNGGSVVVHCLAGVSRSVTVSVAYIATVTGHSWRVALDAVRQSRNVANPNYGFQKQLQAYEDKSLEKERKWLRQKYGAVNPNDHEFIADLYKQYTQTPSQCGGSGIGMSPPNGPSGSYFSAATPVNRHGGLYLLGSSTPASTKTKKGESGVAKPKY